MATECLDAIDMIPMVMGYQDRDGFQIMPAQEAVYRIGVTRVDDYDLPGTGCGSLVVICPMIGQQPDIVVAEGRNRKGEIHVSQIPDVTVSYSNDVVEKAR